MKCRKCFGDGILLNANISCIELALDTIKQHFLTLQELVKEGDRELTLLKERNGSLEKVVELLQSNHENVEKRRKLCPEFIYKTPPKNKKTVMQNATISNHEADNSLALSDSNSPAPASALNMNLAMNSEQLLNSSALSNTTQDETIAETEKIASPSGSWSVRRKLLRHQNNSNCENIKPGSNSSLGWTRKMHESPKRCLSFVSPAATSAIAEKKINLSLNRNAHKMKQSRLQFDSKKDNTKHLKKTTETEKEKDVIDASPNLYTSLKQAKQSRTFMLRNGNSSNVCKNTSKVLSKTALDVGNNSEHYFEFNATTKSNSVLPQVRKTPSPEKLFSASGSSDTSSVMILTPATQDIIFVDDTCDTSKQIETMDLISDLLKLDNDASLQTLKRLESKNISEQKKAAKQAANPIQKQNRNISPKVIKTANLKKERVTQMQGVEAETDPANESTKLFEADFAQNEQYQHEIEDNDDDFVRPIPVKREEDIPTKKRNFKEHFDMCCGDCEKFIKFFGDNLSDRQIEQHLKNCKKCREIKILGHETPADFWNPLMVSFDANDPRKEVLIDDRFKGKKRGQ